MLGLFLTIGAGLATYVEQVLLPGCAAYAWVVPDLGIKIELSGPN